MGGGSDKFHSDSKKNARTLYPPPSQVIKDSRSQTKKQTNREKAFERLNGLAAFKKGTVGNPSSSSPHVHNK